MLVLAKPFYPSLMVASKVGAYQSLAPEKKTLSLKKGKYNIDFFVFRQSLSSGETEFY